MSKLNVLHSLGILVALACCLCACSPEEYGPCSIPNTSAHKAACAPQGENNLSTCMADYVFDCDSLICGIYASSDAFCTHRCIPSKQECIDSGIPEEKCTDGEGGYLKCPAGQNCKKEGGCPEGAACVEWVKGTAAFYCLPAEYSGNDKVSGGNTDAGSDKGDAGADKGDAGSDKGDAGADKGDAGSDTPAEENA